MARHCFPLLAPIFGVLAAIGAAAPGAAQTNPVLDNHSSAVTSYRAGAASRVQDVWPRFQQRGANLDGTLWADDVQGWSANANLFESAQPGRRLGVVDLALGAYVVSEVDIDLPQPGLARWVIARSYNAVQKDGSGYRVSNGPQGKNWHQMSQPEIVLYDDPSSPSEDMLYIVYGADRFLEFKRAGESSNQFKGKNGTAGLVDFVAGTPDTYVYYDQVGTRTYFFGDDTADHKADWQLWKIVDPAGNTVYVGNEGSASSAVTDGYNADGTIKLAFDDATPPRRYTYSYSTSTIGGVKRLEQVLAEIDDGDSTWEAAGAETTVTKVEYAYLAADGDSHGKAGDLQKVTVTEPLTNAARTIKRVRYFRYYGDQAYTDTDGSRGSAHQLKLVLGFEGARKFDWTADALEIPPALASFDSDYVSASDSDLKPYAAVFLEYVSGTDHRVRKVWTDGQCGCSGGPNGAYEVSYSELGTYSTEIGNGTYREDWATLADVDRPDGIWERHYFDETGQALSLVFTDAVPSGGMFTDRWVTHVLRNSDGQVSEIRTPAANSAYDHDDHTYSIHTGAGLVTVLARRSTGDLAGFIEYHKHAKGSGTAYEDSFTDYFTAATKTVGDVTIVRPFISARRHYKATAEGGGSPAYDETTYAHSGNLWAGDAALMPKKVVITHPTVTAAENGSNTATVSEAYFRQDGTVAFSKDEDGVWTYTAFKNGQLARTIEDAELDNTTDYDDYTPGEDPSGTWGITEGQSGVAPFHDRTERVHDNQGRISVVTMHAQAPAGKRLVKEHLYEKLGDERSVQLIPAARDDSVNPPQYHSPAFYGLYNAGGDQDACMLLAWGTWEDETIVTWGSVDELASIPTDPLERFENHGTVERMTVTRRSNTGSRVEETRVYHSVPTSGEGSLGTNYDSTIHAYNDSGRRIRTKLPDGTIFRFAYDERGRAYQLWEGTNDSSFPSGEPSGTDDMVKLEELEHDDGSSNGNNWVTKHTAFVQSSATNARETRYKRDYRGRTIALINGTAPHSVAQRDNLGRVTALALYSSSSGLDASVDPTTTTTNRVSYTQTSFDARGQTWKSVLHKLNTNGTSADTLVSLSWFGGTGRRAMSTGSGSIVKHQHDRLGRMVRTFELATENDSTYDDALTVVGDIVLEEHQTYYDPENGLPLLTSTISRFHSDTTTTGSLDTDDELHQIDYTNGEIKGRVTHLIAQWYDVQHRPTTTARYGTNGGSDFDRTAASEPTASDSSKIVSLVSYNADGSCREQKDPRGKVTRYEYDGAGRLTATIANYIDGTPGADPVEQSTDDVWTRYAYEDGHQVRLWSDLDGDNVMDATEPVTEYHYGVTTADSPGPSAINSGRHLRKVIYPDVETGESEADHATYHAYNAQGQAVYWRDQSTNVHEIDYDLGGRRTAVRFTNIHGSFDNSVQRVEWEYNGRGDVSAVVSYDATAAGNAINGVAHTFDGWGLVSKIEQDRDSRVSTGGNEYYVSFSSAKATPTDAAPALRRTAMNYSGDGLVNYEYSTASYADAASRVGVVKWTPRNGVFPISMASYSYMGKGRAVGLDLPVPDARWQLHEGGSAGNEYPDLDRWGRVKKSRWTSYKNGGTRDFHSVTLEYDAGSMLTSADDLIHTTGWGGGGTSLWDAKYDVDDLNRLSRAAEGHLSAGSITTYARDEQWTFSQTMAILLHELDLDGDLNYNETNELTDRGVFSLANELKTRNTDDSGAVEFTLTHDKAGNLTDDGLNYSYKYDALHRLVQVRKRSSGVLVAEYKYNGLNHRIGEHVDMDGDGDVDANDQWLHTVFDDRWRAIAIYRGTDTDPKVQYLYSAAGKAGYGGSDYIDRLLLRERDANGGGGMNGAADGALEERVFFCQDQHADVVAVLSSGGSMVERAKYSAYGVPYGMPGGDTDSDGDYDSTDKNNIAGTYDIRKDVDLDGDVDAGDVTAAGGTTYVTLGYGVLSKPAIGNRRGYAGYELEPLAGTLYNLRYRNYSAERASFLERDPLLYHDGPNLYAYGRGLPGTAVDPMGLAACFGCASPTEPPPAAPGSPGGEPQTPPVPIDPDITPTPVQPAPPPYIEPWNPECDDKLKEECKKACDSSKAHATAWCIDGQPVICVCEKSPSNPESDPPPADGTKPKSFADQYRECQKKYEEDQWKDGVNPPCGEGYTGNPHNQEGRTDEDKKERRCKKAQKLQEFSECIGNISCPKGDEGRDCRNQRCVQRESHNCLAKAYKEYCGSGTLKEAEERAGKAYTKCQQDFNKRNPCPKETSE